MSNTQISVQAMLKPDSGDIFIFTIGDEKVKTTYELPAIQLFRLVEYLETVVESYSHWKKGESYEDIY